MRTWLGGWVLVVGMACGGGAWAQDAEGAAPERAVAQSATDAPPQSAAPERAAPDAQEDASPERATAQSATDAAQESAAPDAQDDAPEYAVPMPDAPTLRVLLRDGSVMDAEPALDGTALQLPDGTVWSLDHPDLSAVRVRGRGWGVGAGLGAVLGGLGVGTWFAVRCGTDAYGYIGTAFCFTGGELLGAVTGGFLGLLVGGAVPAWQTAWQRGAPLPDLRPHAQPAFGPRLGEVALVPGYAWRLEDAGDAPRTRHGPGLQLQFLVPLGRHAALGVEGAAYDLGTTTDSPRGWGAPVAPRRLDLWRVGPVVRAHLPLGRVRPGVLAGLALSVLDGDATAVASAGVGVDVDVVPRRLAATVQVRGGRALDHDPTATHSVTAGVGARLLW